MNGIPAVVSIVGASPGQQCRVGDLHPYSWYHWTGDAWVYDPPDADLVHRSGTETVSGAKSFTGQMELTGQAATNPTSAMTVALMAGILTGLSEWSKNGADYSNTIVSGGSVTTGIGLMVLNTSATAGSSIQLNSDASNYRSWHRGGNTGRGVVNWGRRTVHHVKLASDSFAGADTVIRILLGLPNTFTTVADFSASNKGIGLKIVNGLINIHVANGSAVTTVSSGVTLVAWDEYDITIESSGSGAWKATVNNTVISGTGAPTGLSAAGNRSLCAPVTNGSTAATRRFFINSMKTLQH